MKKLNLPPLEGDTGQEVLNLTDILGYSKPAFDSTKINKELSKALKTEGIISARVKAEDGKSLIVDMGDLNAFIPIEEVDPDRTVSLAGFVGNLVRVKVISLDLEKNQVVLSRKQARIEDAKNLLTSIKSGDVVKGIVKVILPYGCFVELGGVAGLLKDRDIAHHPVKAQKLFTVGQSIEVQITEITKNNRIYLSTKNLLPKPGLDAFRQIVPGHTYEGSVVSVHSFGVFVRIKINNVEALCSLPPTGNIFPGQAVSVKINQVIPEEGKAHGNIKKFLI